MTTIDIIKQVKKVCNKKITVTDIRFNHWIKFVKKEQTFSVTVYYKFQNKASNFSVDLFAHRPQTMEYLISQLKEEIARINGKPYDEKTFDFKNPVSVNL